MSAHFAMGRDCNRGLFILELQQPSVLPAQGLRKPREVALFAERPLLIEAVHLILTSNALRVGVAVNHLTGISYVEGLADD